MTIYNDHLEPNIKIGNRSLLASFPQLQIPVNQIATIEMTLLGRRLKVNISFIDNQGHVDIKIVNDGPDCLNLTLLNWSNPVGVALTEPQVLAAMESGAILEFLSTNYRIGSLNVFSLMILHDEGAK